VVGARLLIIPAHICTAVNLHTALMAVAANHHPRWLSVDARRWIPNGPEAGQDTGRERALEARQS